MRARTLTVSLCLLTLCACAAQEPAKEEQRAAAPQTNAAPLPPAAPPPTTATTPEASQPSTPAPQDARAAVERIYKGAVVFDARASDAAAVGDFNGDGSEDLVVRARAAPGRLAEVNDEVANWIVSDPRNVVPPDPRQFNPHQGVQKLAPHPRPQVGAADALLVVVHGYKEAGWRNPEAQQTFLLKGVAGEGLRPERRADAAPAARDRHLRLVGDVLHEKLGGAQGFLYWTGAGYGWLGEEGRQ